MEETYTGTVKSYNPAKGWGFIESDATFALFGKDIFLLKSALPPGLEPSKGQTVSFCVIQGDRGLQAGELQFHDEGRRGGGGGGCAGGQSGSSGGRGSYGMGGGGPSRMGGASAGGSPGNFVGTIKSFNEEKGWGFVTSDAIIEMYGKDIFFRRNSLGMGTSTQTGTQVSFSVQQGDKGPMAENIVAVGGGRGGYGGCGGCAAFGLPPPPAFGFGGFPSAFVGGFSGFGPPMVGGGRGPPSTMGKPMGLGSVGSKVKPDQRFYGSLKSYNAEKGWGHISCAASESVYGKDVFVLRSAIGEQQVQPGTLVAFKVVQANKGPQAAELVVLPQGAFGHDGVEGRTYEGEVKSFKEEKGWGFATSEEIQQMFGKDIFLHKRELGDNVPKQGDPIRFSVEQGPSGQLEAKNVQLGGGDAEVEELGFEAYGAVRTGAIRPVSRPY